MTMSPVRDGESDSAVCEPLTQRGHRVRACRAVRVGVGYLEIDLTIQRQFEQEITFTGYCRHLTGDLHRFGFSPWLERHVERHLLQHVDDRVADRGPSVVGRQSLSRSGRRDL